MSDIWAWLGVVALAGSIACSEKGDGKSGPAGDDTGGADDTGTPGPDPDLDHDGYPQSLDCNDNDYQVNPGATEACDELDNDCDGDVDEGFDADGDGVTSAAHCEDGTDCDDNDPLIAPHAEEVPYDGVDQDCDGVDLVDVDADGFDGAEAGGNDCDDEDPAVHPDVLDWMNDGTDADCDGFDGDRMSLEDAPVTVDGDSGVQAYLGSGVAVCDLDLDGLDDLVVTAPLGGAYYEGLIGVFYGAGSAAWGSGLTLDDADVLITGDDYFLGFGVTCVDVDGDGRSDFAITAPEWGGGTTTSTGRVYLYLSSRY